MLGRSAIRPVRSIPHRLLGSPVRVGDRACRAHAFLGSELGDALELVQPSRPPEMLPGVVCLHGVEADCVTDQAAEIFVH